MGNGLQICVCEARSSANVLLAPVQIINNKNLIETI